MPTPQKPRLPRPTAPCCYIDSNGETICSILPPRRQPKPATTSTPLSPEREQYNKTITHVTALAAKSFPQAGVFSLPAYHDALCQFAAASAKSVTPPPSYQAVAEEVKVEACKRSSYKAVAEKSTTYKGSTSRVYSREYITRSRRLEVEKVKAKGADNDDDEFSRFFIARMVVQSMAEYVGKITCRGLKRVCRARRGAAV